jgi:O-antigen/teichoic acid export membrane protein
VRLVHPLTPEPQRGPGRPQRRDVLSAGTAPVAVGILLQGASQYVFLAIAAHALGVVLDAAFAAFWSLLSVVGPGFMAPLEQTTARAVAARQARGLGTRPLVLRATALCAALALLLMLACALAAGPLVQHAFTGTAAFLPVLMAGVAVFALHFLARGILAGHGRFVAYGTLLALDGALRVVICAAFAIAGLRAPAAYGLAIVLGSLIAVTLALLYAPRLLCPGPRSGWNELSVALGYLVAASCVLQFFVSVGALAVQLLASPDQQSAAARFLSSRVVSFIPLFLFTAVVAPLLPRLTRLATLDDRAQFARVLRLNLGIAATCGAVTALGAALVGPFASGILFGAGFQLGPVDFALLGGVSGGLMLAQVLQTALIAVRAFGRLAAGWLTGAVAFFVVITAIPSLFVRVELALFLGALIAAAAMWIVLRIRLHAPQPLAAGAERIAPADMPAPP